MARPQRLMEYVRRADPNPDRPRLPDEVEKEFVEVDRSSAALYCELEELSARFADLACELNAVNGNGGVPVSIEEGDSSLVIHIEESTQSLKKRTEE